jgi:hypothetical protein
MKLLRRAHDLITAHHWANLLHAAGIRCEVRNTALTGALGDIPFLEATPQLWVLNDLELDQAELLLKELERAPPDDDWHCKHCGERCESQFFSCWRCGTERIVPNQQQAR